MRRGWKYVVGLLLVMLWSSVAVAAPDTGVTQQKPLTKEQMYKMSSAVLLRRADATAEEDYQAGTIAYDRAELVEAQGLFERAAKKGHTGAMDRYAEILSRAGFINEAAASYRQAAELGDANAQFSLASMYMDLNSYDLKDVSAAARPGEARKWLVKAAEQGHASAISLLASAYVNGGLGLTDADRSDAEILKWLKQAANVGDSSSMGKLAEAYRNGQYGLAVDVDLAKEWDKKANEAFGIKQEEKQVVKRKKKRI